MLRDEQLAGSACSEYLDSYKNRSDHHSVHSIHADGIDWMQIRQWLTFRPTECHVPTEVLHSTARFDSAYDISSRQMLVLKAYVGLRGNSYFVQAAQRFSRQGEPAMREQVSFLHHALTLTPSIELV
jgi:hypothetical protein